MGSAKKQSKKAAAPSAGKSTKTAAKKAASSKTPQKAPSKAQPVSKAKPASAKKTAKKAAKASKPAAPTKAAKGSTKGAAKKSEPKAKSKAARVAPSGPPAPRIEPPKAPPLPLNNKRKLGLRGAAPWAARHAAKHAAEARARAAEPAPPGSARATIRTPSGAEQIKAKIGELHTLTTKIRQLRKRLDKGFFEIGELLGEVNNGELYEAKGYGSFEAFLEREIDIGKMTCLKLVRVATIFQKDAALDYGMDRCLVAMSALEGDLLPRATPSAPGSKPPSLPLKPPSRMVG